MDKKFGIIAVIMVCCTIIICVTSTLLTFKNYKKDASGGVTVTGSATTEFTSDLIVWRGSFSRKADTTKDAYAQLKTDSETIKKYLTDSGIKDSEIVFSAVTISQSFTDSYSQDSKGNSTSVRVPDGYVLTQNVTIQSSEVDKVEGVSRDITKLIDSGVEFLSNQPEYYYSKLDSLKLKLIEDATLNAKSRADIIAKNANATLGTLGNATLGIFQITGTNSSDEQYSYSGVFNTSSKEKTAAVTVTLHYNNK